MFLISTRKALFFLQKGIASSISWAMLLWIVVFIPQIGKAQTIAAWDFFGITSGTPQSTYPAAVFNANLVATNQITRGSLATASPGANSFRTQAFKNDGVSVANNDYFQITLSPAIGYNLSLSTIDARCKGTASFCAAPGVDHMFAYSLDGVTFTVIGTQNTIGGSGATGIALAQVSLSSITALQNVPTGTTVTIRYYATGQTTTGGWGFFNSTAGTYGLAIGGTTTAASTNTITTGAVTPTTTFTLASCSATTTGTVAFTSTGTFTGNTYTAQLSDAAGSFATPLNIGTLVSNANTGTINITIPAGTLTSASYRIRVISSGPSVLGSNSAAFTITQSGSCSTTSTDFFQSNPPTGTGVWATPGNWQSSLDNGVTDPWITATLAPTGSSKGITIRSGHNITVAASVGAANILVNNGGILTVASGQTLTVANGANAIDLDVSGTVVNAGAIAFTAPANSTFQAGSIYQHTASAAGNAIITASWNATSTCSVSGMVATGPTTASMGQNFGNFIWSCAGQTADYNIENSAFTTQGKLTIEQTGAGTNNLALTAAATGMTNTFGSLDVNGGVFNIITYTSGSVTSTATINGDVTVTGGALSLAGGTLETGLSAKTEVGILKIAGNLSVSGSPASFYGSSTSTNHYPVGRVDFIKAGTQTVEFTNTGTVGFVNYYVNSGSTLQVLTGGLPLRSTSATEFDALTINASGTIDFGVAGTVYESSQSYAKFITSNLSTVITSNPGGLMGATNVANTTAAPITAGSIRVGTTAAVSRVFTAGTSYIFNAATTSAFPTVNLQLAFGSPLNITLGANITLNRPAASPTGIIASGTLALGNNVLTQLGTNLGFSAITGSGSVVGDNGCGITVAGAVGVPGTLTLSGSKTVGQLFMNRTGTLTLGSDVIIDGSTVAYAPASLSLLRLGNAAGIVDGSGRTLTFISRSTREPIGGTGIFNVSSTTNLIFNATLATSVTTIPPTTFTAATVSINDLTINRTATLTLSDNFNINGTLTITNGTLDAGLVAGSNTLDGTGNFTMTGGKLLLRKFPATLPELTGTYNLTGGNVEFAGTGTGAGNEQTLRGGKDYYDIIFSGGGDRILPNGSILGIKNSITPSTNITTVTNSLVDFKGAAQSIPAFTTSTTAPYVKQFNSVRFSGTGTKTLAESFTMLDSLKIYDGITLAVGTNAVTLKSTQVQTARVAAIEGSGNITYGAGGKFIVERFIPAHRSWRFMCAPLQAGEQTLNAAWQEGATTTAANPNPGYGTHISGGSTRTSAQGFDLGPANSSIYGYNAGTGSWNVIPATTNALDINLQPLMLFVRGSRAINLPASTPSTTADQTVLRASGKITTTASYSFPATAGFAPLVNPVAAPINFHTLSKTNIVGGVGGDAYYMWNPYLTGSNGVGAWVSFSWNGTSYDQAILTGTGTASITSTGVIPSSAAFMVSQSGSGTVAIAQKDITTDAVNGANQQPYTFRPSRDVRTNRLRTSLFALNADGTKSLNDGALIVFSESYNNAVDNEDMLKLDNFSENISMANADKKLVIERRKLATVRDTIFYSISKMKQKNYELQLAAEKSLCNASMKAYLEDNFTNTKTAISTSDTTYYSFAVTADAGSTAANRFRIVFKPSGIAAVGFKNITGFKQNKGIALEWNVSGELDIAGYEVEKSLDGGQTFVKIDGLFIPAKSNEDDNRMYNWFDANPVKGDNFYRVKGMGINGITSYSDMVKVSFAKTAPAIAIYPNPIVNNTIGLQMDNMPAGNYAISLVNQNGQTLFSQRLNHTALKGLEKISLNKTIASGIYQLKIVQPGGAVTTLKLMK